LVNAVLASFSLLAHPQPLGHGLPF